MKLIQDFIPKGRKNRPGGTRIPLKITIHDTANKAAHADAEAHAAYLQTITAVNKPVSWHFTVDSRKVVQHLPISEPAYNAGDGNGPGNKTAIAIEICENSDDDRAKAEANAVELVAWLLTQTNLVIADVVQHNHWSGKDCPHIIRARPNGWNIFLKEVERHMGFTDVPKNHWAAAAIRAAADKGIIQGYSDGSFKPDQPITRAELAVVLSRLK